MKKNKKKYIFPKLKKTLGNFLTDESGKMTKKDALGVAAGAALFSGAEEALATSVHFNNFIPPGGSRARQGSNGAGPYGTTNNYTYNMEGTCSVNHGSGIVNGHYSRTPTGSASPTGVGPISGHGSHNSY